MPKKQKSNSGMDIPDHQFETIARCLLPKIQAYYESEEGQKAFVKWKEKMANRKDKETKRP